MTHRLTTDLVHTYSINYTAAQLWSIELHSPFDDVYLECDNISFIFAFSTLSLSLTYNNLMV